MLKITTKLLNNFKVYLIEEEKSPLTIEKYIRDVSQFKEWVKNETLSKKLVICYKNQLCEKYAPRSVNSILSSLNSFFEFNEWFSLKVKTLKIQKQIFSSQEKELTKAEYVRLLKAAQKKNNERLFLLMQTICSTGIRISELKYITVDAISKGIASINLKGKLRQIFLPNKLCSILKIYIRKSKITSGPIFITKNGKPLDRSNIWSDMKKLCAESGVLQEKVFPHNLRHLFARTYYNLQKDIVRLADLLGHSNINTTRIYTIETGEIHKKQVEKLGLLVC